MILTIPGKVSCSYKAIVTTSHHNCFVLFPDDDDADDVDVDVDDDDDDDDDDDIDVDDDDDDVDVDDDDDHLGGPQLKALFPSSEIVLSARGTVGQTIFSWNSWISLKMPNLKLSSELQENRDKPYFPLNIDAIASPSTSPVGQWESQSVSDSFRDGDGTTSFGSLFLQNHQCLATQFFEIVLSERGPPVRWTETVFPTAKN